MNLILITDDPRRYQATIEKVTRDLPAVSGGVTNQPEATGDILLVTDSFLMEESFHKLVKKRRSKRALLIALGELTEAERITLLQLGADEVWQAPMNPEEMKARLQAIIRWLERQEVQEYRFDHGQLRILPETKQVFWQEQELSLTASEYQILFLMATHPNRIYSREELLLLTKNERGGTRAIDTHMKNLRRKLATDNGQQYLKTVHGRGYRFEAN